MRADVVKFEEAYWRLSSICQSGSCVRAAALIIDKMDVSVDPCEDFYQFACGNYVRSKAVPHDRLSRNILQEIQDEIYIDMKSMLEQESKNDSLVVQAAKKFYASCMRESEEEDDATAAALILETVNESGGPWCLLEAMMGASGCQDRDVNLEQRLASAFMNQIPSLFNMFIASPDEKNDTKYALHVSQSGKSDLLSLSSSTTRVACTQSLH